MAWTARIDSIAQIDVRLSVGVSYYDAADTGFASALYSTTLSFSADSSNADMRTDIVNIGKTVRAAQARRDALLVASPPGTTLAVP